MLVSELLLERQDFSKYSTSTSNKDAIDAAIYSKVKMVSGKHVIMLVGSSDGLQRHLDAAVKTLHLESLDNLWIVDNQPQVIKSLQQFFPSIAKNYKGTPNFVAADFLSFLNKWDKSKKIGFVDFDGTSPVSKYHIKVYEKCLQLDVDYVAMVGVARVQDKEIEALGASLGYEDVFRREYINKKEQLKRGLEYKNWRQEWKYTNPSTKDILIKYLVDDSGQELLVDKNYQGAGKAQMFALLFKVH